MSDRTGWAGFATAALNSLGRSAPWVVIGCVTAFAVYKLQEQSQASFAEMREISDTERKAAREDFVQANATLQTSFKGVQDLTDKMLTSFRDQLQQMQQMEASVRQKQQEAFESRVEAQKTLIEVERQKSELDKNRDELSALRVKIEKSREEATALARESYTAQVARADALEKVELLRESLAAEQQMLTTARENLTATRESLAATKEESDRLNEDLKARRAELDQAFARLEEVLGVLTRLATIPDDITQSELAALRDRAQEILPGVKTFLSSYLKQPVASRDAVTTSSIVGVTLAELKSAMVEATEIHWYLAKSHSDNFSIFGVPASEGAKSVVENVLSISTQLADIEVADAARYFEQKSLETFDSTQIQGINFVSSVAFACIVPSNISNKKACRTANNAGLVWTSANDFKFSRLLGLQDGVLLFNAPNPNVAPLDHKKATKHMLRLGLLDLETGRSIRRDKELFSYALAISGADEVDIELPPSELPSKVHDALEKWLSERYKKIASSENSYSAPIAFSGVGSTESTNVGAFFSEVLARILDERLATGSFPQVYQLTATQKKDVIRVEATGKGRPDGFSDLPDHLIISVDDIGQGFSLVQSTMPNR